MSRYINDEAKNEVNDDDEESLENHVSLFRNAKCKSQSGTPLPSQRLNCLYLIHQLVDVMKLTARHIVNKLV
jgi:hypothetical protein